MTAWLRLLRAIAGLPRPLRMLRLAVRVEAALAMASWRWRWRRLDLVEWKWRLISLRTRAAATLLRLGLGPRPPYGHMTLDRWYAWGFHRAGGVTLVNGEAIPGLIEFDDVRGIAIAYTTRPPRRHPYLDRPETRLVRGRIDVVFDPTRRRT